MALIGADLQLQFPDGLRWFSLDLMEKDFEIVKKNRLRSRERTTKSAFICGTGLIVIFICAEFLEERKRKKVKALFQPSFTEGGVGA